MVFATCMRQHRRGFIILVRPSTSVESNRFVTRSHIPSVIVRGKECEALSDTGRSRVEVHVLTFMLIAMGEKNAPQIEVNSVGTAQFRRGMPSMCLLQSQTGIRCYANPLVVQEICPSTPGAQAWNETGCKYPRTARTARPQRKLQAYREWVL